MSRRMFLFCLLVFFHYWASVIQGSFSFPSTELSALHDLYNSTGGSHWVWRPTSLFGEQWNFSSPNPNPCSELWQGITCTSKCISSQCYVQSIILNTYGLRGTLPSSLNDLKHLKSLELKGNSISGVIPPTITQIVTLEDLQLSFNSLHSTIPSQIGQLTNLKTLDLSNNLLASTLPFSLSSLRNLNYLSLAANGLNGSLSFTTFSSYMSLTYLDLSRNNFIGTIPLSLYSISTLQTVSLHSNDLQGTISESIGNWKNIQTIDFHLNSFIKSIPQNICHLTALSFMDLTGNLLHGTIPNCISALQNLTILNLAQNLLDGTIPDLLFNHSKLQGLSLYENLLTGSIPIPFIPETESNYKLFPLSSIIIDKNQLTGTIGKGIAVYSNLTELYLQVNKLTGSICEEIGQLKKLEVLDWSVNMLTGTIPDTIINMASLTQLSLFNNTLHGTLPDNFTALVALNTLYIYGNEFSGTFPKVLFYFPDLSEINLDTNQFSGTIPGDVENAKSMAILIAGSNYLTGTIPNEIGELKRLEVFEVDYNLLSGTFSNALTHIWLLNTLILSGNQLHGTIPSNITLMLALVKLQMSSNYLHGTIPEKLGNLRNLQILGLNSNQFTGSIPDSIVQCTALESIDFRTNDLTGTIPEGIGNFVRLNYFAINQNRLTGTIPTSIFTQRLPSLRFLFVADNLLTGTIPNEINQAVAMNQVNFGINLLTGTMPDTIGKAPDLNFFYAFMNELTGSIPETMYHLESLVYLYFFQNQLTGTISSNISRSLGLRQFDCHHNFLTGTLPDDIFSLPALNFVYMDQNYFYGELPFNRTRFFTPIAELLLNENMMSGSLPKTVYHLRLMESMNLSSNFLTGSLPTTMNQLRALIVLDLSYNEFRGCLNGTINKLKQLRLFFAQNNGFECRLDNVFNASSQLNVVDVSNNKFSGSLPVSAFVSQNLTSFAAVKNCFSGSIPAEICVNSHMQTLALDGLHAADACKTKFLSFLPARILEKSIQGSIPSCLFSMPSLETLHLSGNGIQGSIPQDLVLSPSLSDLSLSHNLLSDSIPQAIQTHSWKNLDLSFNKLNGRLVSEILALDGNQSLSLTVNRLSGPMPSTLVSAEDIDVLRGNLFGCTLNARKQELPRHDSYFNSYQCGSNSIDVPMYIWAAIVGILTSMFLLLSSCGLSAKLVPPQKWIELNAWWGVFRGENAINSFGSDLANLRNICMQWVALVLLVLLPLYGALRVYFSTHVFTYAWSISLAFMGGITPAVIMLIVFVCVLFLVEYYIDSLNQQIRTRTNMANKRISVSDANLEVEATTRQTLSAATDFHRLSTLVAVNANSHSIVDRGSCMLPRPSSHQEGLHAIEDTNPLTIGKDPQPEAEVVPNNKENNKSIKSHQSQKSLWIPKLKFTVACICIILANTFIVLIVNALYVYAITVDLNPILTSLITLAITAFKVIWSIYVVAGFICDMFQKTLNIYVESLVLKTADESKTTENILANKQFLTLTHRYETIASRLLIILSLFNSVFAPCLAVLLVSPECFYYVITSPPHVEVSYEFVQCEGIYNTLNGLNCVGKSEITHSSSFQPAFSYSYQCSSALLENFVDVYLLRYLITGVLVPVVSFFCHQGQTVIAKAMVTDCRSLQANETNVHVQNVKFWKKSMFRILSALMPFSGRLVDPRKLLKVNATAADSTDDLIVHNVNPILQGNQENASNTEEPIPLKEDESETIIIAWSQQVLPKDPNQIFMARKFTTILVGDVAILLTFGSIFPPLAVVVGLSLVGNSMLSQLVIGRFLVIGQNLHSSSILQKYIDVIKRETAAVGSLIALALAPITVLATLFWSFFLFDIIGDEIGATKALWVVLVLISCFALMKCVIKCQRIQTIRNLTHSLREYFQAQVFSQEKIKKVEYEETGGIELRDSWASP